MSDPFRCPYCNEIIPMIKELYSKRRVSFGGIIIDSNNENEEVNISYFKCPNCKKYTVISEGLGKDVKFPLTFLKPQSNAIKYPEYIPKQIRQDYEEACAIVRLSPKASATLSRRCLQGMIRDFWGIQEKNLYTEISSLRDKVYPTQWAVLDSLRKLGNIGAHPERDINIIVDIEPDEATKLIKVIELLMKDWYIQRYETEKLYSDVLDIGSSKEVTKNSSDK